MIANYGLKVKKAWCDLDEAMIIAERGSIRIWGIKGMRGHFAKAKEMIGKIGYHRRDEEVKELEEQLSKKGLKMN